MISWDLASISFLGEMERTIDAHGMMAIAPTSPAFARVPFNYSAGVKSSKSKVRGENRFVTRGFTWVLLRLLRGGIGPYEGFSASLVHGGHTKAPQTMVWAVRSELWSLEPRRKTDGFVTQPRFCQEAGLSPWVLLRGSRSRLHLRISDGVCR